MIIYHDFMIFYHIMVSLHDFISWYHIWGNRRAATGGTIARRPQYQHFKSLCKNPLDNLKGYLVKEIRNIVVYNKRGAKSPRGGLQTPWGMEGEAR